MIRSTVVAIALLTGCATSPPPVTPQPAPPAAPATSERATGERLATLSAQPTEAELDPVLTLLRERADLRVELGGHTNSRGSGAFNQKVSQERAEKARQFLVDNGITAGRVIARGYGESRPIASNATAQGRAKNARLEVVAAP